MMNNLDWIRATFARIGDECSDENFRAILFTYSFKMTFQISAKLIFRRFSLSFSHWINNFGIHFYIDIYRDFDFDLRYIHLIYLFLNEI